LHRNVLADVVAIIIREPAGSLTVAMHAYELVAYVAAADGRSSSGNRFQGPGDKRVL